MNLSKIEFLLLKQLKLQPSEMDRMEFYRLEYLMDHLKEHNEEEAKRRKEEENKQKNESDSYSKMKSGFKEAMPKMPNFKI